MGVWSLQLCSGKAGTVANDCLMHRQRREGPWRSRQGRYTIFLSFSFFQATAICNTLVRSPPKHLNGQTKGKGSAFRCIDSCCRPLVKSCCARVT
jgi:hypothetical protein